MTRQRLSRRAKTLLAILLVSVVASCKQDAPPAPVMVDRPQVAVSQAWQEMANRSIFSPSLRRLDQNRVIAGFWGLVDPQEGLGKNSARPLLWKSRADFEATAKGSRFDELDKVAALITNQPKEAARWHVYGAWINAVGRSFDDRLAFYPPSRQQDVDRQVKVSAQGLGIELTEDENGVRVGSLDPQGPAFSKGIKPGTKLVSITEKGKRTDLSKKTVYEIAQLLKGPPGTRVDLVLREANKKRSVAMVREHWSLDEGRVSSRSIQRAGRHFFLVKVPGFYVDADPAGRWYVSTSKDLEAALKLARVEDVVVLDFRSNPGGVLDEALLSAGHLGLSGKVWQIKTRFDRPIAHSATTPLARRPVAIWVDGQTASAAEILTGALQLSGVRVVGSTTYGKNSMQLLVPLDRRSQMMESASNTGMLLLSTGFVAWDPRQSKPAPVVADCRLPGATATDDAYLDATVSCLPGT